MEVSVGEHLTLTKPALNPATGKILFDSGTKVEVVETSPSLVRLKFPDGRIYSHEATHIPALFSKHTTNGFLRQAFTGKGTPPKQMFDFLPKEADWKKNYKWTIMVTLEETGETKEFICPICLAEIKDVQTKVPLEVTQCNQCQEYVTPAKVSDIENNLNNTTF